MLNFVPSKKKNEENLFYPAKSFHIEIPTELCGKLKTGSKLPYSILLLVNSLITLLVLLATEVSKN